MTKNNTASAEFEKLNQNPDSAGNFLQSEKWMEVNRLVGHKTLKKSFRNGIYNIYMIIKDARRGRYLEIPGGPLIDWTDQTLVDEVFSEIKNAAKSEKCVFVRFRPQLLDTPENRELLKSQDAKLAPMHLHAPHTVIIDLSPDEDTLLANMRRQTRYEVRRSKKQGLIVEKGSAKNLYEEFHSVQVETAERQHFIPPSGKDLLAERKAFGDGAVIYVAKTEDKKPVAYGLFLKHGVEADYFEAASTDLNRKFSGAYALQWQAIRDFKREGFSRYNLWGIAPPNSPNHRYAGVTTFKTGFGGENVTFIPAHDIIINKVRYLKDYLIETARKKARKL